MKVRYAVVLVLLLVLLPACDLVVNMGPAKAISGSGNVVTQNRPVGSVSAVSFNGIGEVIITQGSAEALTIEAEDNILPEIKTETKGSTLVIGFSRGNAQQWVFPTKAIRFNLTVRNLLTIETLGAGNIRVNRLTTDRLTIKVSGAGNVKIEGLVTPELTTTITGAGNVDIAGQAARQTATLNGLGNLDAGDLKSQTVKVTLNGAGNATVWATEKLDATIAGLGSVRYYGSPSITKNVTGVGGFTSLGNK